MDEPKVEKEMSMQDFSKMMANGQRVGLTDEEAAKYIDGLMGQGGDIGLTPIEKGVLQRLRKGYSELLHGNQRLQQLKAETDRLAENLKNLRGKVNGYVDVLLDAEGQRRSDEVSKKVSDLKKAGG